MKDYSQPLKDYSKPSKDYSIPTDAMSPNDNSIYARGGAWDLKKKFGRFSGGPKVLGLPIKELAMTAGIPPLSIYEVATKKPSEDLLPMVGQLGGGAIAEAASGGNQFLGGAGGIAGAVVGQAARQGVKAMRGYQPNLGEVVFEIPRTAIGEATGRIIPRAAFFNQYGGKARQAAGKALGETAEAVQKKAPFIRFAKKDIQDQLGQAIEDAPFESGPQRTALVKIKNRLEAQGAPLSFDEMRQLEQEMGRRAQFAKGATEGKFKLGPPAPRSNEALKIARNDVSNQVDEAASNAGFPEFKTQSKEFSRLVKKYPEEKLQAMYGQPGIWGRGAAGIGAMELQREGRNDPGSNALKTALAWYALPPRFRTSMFRNIVDKPLGRVAGRALTLGATQLLRPGDDQ
jgi:hypothetical protein